MKIPGVRHITHHEQVPLLPVARSRGRRQAWPSEGLERLLTRGEVDALTRGRFVR